MVDVRIQKAAQEPRKNSETRFGDAGTMTARPVFTAPGNARSMAANPLAVVASRAI